MRIIGGEFKSRRLITPRDAEVTRPIPDRVKESLFSILRGHTEGAAVFDGFAGTGAIGLEAISRGAARCVFVEKDRDAAAMLRQNIDSLGAGDRAELVIGDALGPGALARCPRPADLIFFDPPYPLVRDPVGWKRVRAQFERLIDLLADDGFAVIRTPWPLVIEVPEEEASPAPAARPRREDRGRRGSAKGKDRRRGRWEDQTEQDPEEAEDADGGAEAEEPPGAEAAVQRIPGDLSFPNAVGPETHVYSAMAVHLYMRKRADAVGAS